jgi:methionyl-tRNA formyltransferase
LIRVVVLAPLVTSLYSRLVTHLASLEPGINVTDIILRTPWSWKRVKTEFKLEGGRLLSKVLGKMILKERQDDQTFGETLGSLAHAINLPGRDLKDLARIHNIRLTVVQDLNDPVAESRLKDASVDVIAFTGGGLIRKNILELPRLGVLNCHMGLLPLYRGMYTYAWPLLESNGGEPSIGLTLHFMDQGIDTGPILLREPVALEKGDTIETLKRRMGPKMVKLMLAGLRGLRDGLLTPQAQQEGAGRQYFVMHPRILSYAESKL